MATEEEKLKFINKIIDTINNRKNLSEEEITAVYNHSLKFAQSLPETERGAFYLDSCFEQFGMLVEGLYYKKELQK